jgi:DNA-binding NtrC family response regulator
MSSEIFILSKDQEETALIKDTLKAQGCEVRASSGVSSALRSMKGSEVILLSFDGQNLETLKEIRSYHPEAVVLVSDGADSGNKVLKEGAYDFLEKPLSPVKLGTSVRNALDFIAYRNEIHRLKITEAPQLVTSKNRKMLMVYQQTERASTRNNPVLILGEKGTGKDLIARTIHYNSTRMAAPLVIVEDPAAEGDTGLFGRTTTKGISHGKVMEAKGGTIVLKNVDKLEPELSRKLAAFIKEKKFSPEGSDAVIRPGVRVVCSAPSLDARSSLFKSFRTKISIPPLRERHEDIVPLAEHFLKTDCAALKKEAKRFSRGAKDFLLENDWPGNAGELKNTVKKACLISKEALVERRHLASGDGAAYCSIREFLDDKLNGYLKGMAKVGNSGLYDTVTSEVEKSLIELVLKETGGNQLKASRLLGLNRNTLRAKIKLYKIKNGRKTKS